MNATATRIGMTNTQFVSSTGGAELTLELKGTTTARDMALLANQMFFDFSRCLCSQPAKSFGL